MVRRPVLAVLSGTLLLEIAVLALPRLPIGNFWWDALVFDGVNRAIDQGLVPTRDFWATMILPLYLNWLAERIKPDGNHYLVLQWLQWLIVVAYWRGFLARGLRDAENFGWSALLFLCAFIPINSSHAVSDLNGFANYAGFYNRFGDALLILAFLTVLVYERRPRPWIFAAGAFLLCALALYTKLSVLCIVAVLLAAGLVLCRAPAGTWLRALLVPAALALLFLAVDRLWGIGRDYLEIVRQVGKYKQSAFVEELWNWRGHRLLHVHGLEWGLIAGIAGTLGARAFFLPPAARWVALFDGRWALMGLLVWGGAMAFTATNYGDWGTGPALVVLAWGLADTLRPFRRPVASPWRRCLLALMLATTLFGAFATIVPVYRWLRVQMNPSRVYAPLVDNETSVFGAQWLINSESRNLRPLLEDYRVPSSSMMFRRSDFHFWAVIHQELAQSLRGRVAPGETVYELDFPAFALHVLEPDFRVPRRSYAWLLYTHDFGDGHEPDVHRMLSDVTWLVVPRCQLNANNRQHLAYLFRPAIEADFTLQETTDCFRVYRRRPPR